jgi:hypothetical protein
MIDGEYTSKMAKKAKVLPPITKCQVLGCDNPAIGGFREFIDTSSFDGPSFNVEPLNCCAVHKKEQHPRYAGKNYKWVDFSKI